MYLRKTQGDPIYYRYSDVRAWAATRIGLEYSFKDQCYDFFERVFPTINEVMKTPRGAAKVFDDLFTKERSKVSSAKDPTYLALADVEAMDIYYSRQPKWAKIPLPVPQA